MGARTSEVERGAIATVRVDDDEGERARRGVVVRGEREEGAVQLAPRTKREFHDDYWTNQHLKLLYLVSKYSNCAQTAREKERWVRKLPLLKVFEYDYAPESTVVKNSRVYLNVSQEGVDDLDDLIEGALLRGLRLSSTEHQSVLAFQITAAGLALVAKRMHVEDRLLVDELCIADGKLLQVSWEDEKFYLRNETISFESSITDVEDVSYVVSPYLPLALRRVGGPVTSSNSHRAAESAAKDSTIRDDLDEVITISNVTVLVGEFVPFGVNQIVKLNMKLGSNDRCQGDAQSTNTECEIPTGLTNVSILDHDMTTFANIEAQVYYPEDDGIIQVEHFGIHLRKDGTVVHGLLIESVMDRILDNISLDNLARLLVDVHMDSSKILDSLLSDHQRDLLRTVFLNHSERRDKINVIIAERIAPQQAADICVRNELRQILGDTREAHDLTDRDVVITGSHGILLSGPNAKAQEPVMLMYLSITSRDVFVHNVFNRIFMTDDILKSVRLMIRHHEEDPNSVAKIRRTLGETSKDVILLEEILVYLKESIEQDASIHATPQTETGRRLYSLLGLDVMIADLEVRVLDMQKIVMAARKEIDALQIMADTIAESHALRVHEDIRGNSSEMLMQMKSNTKQGTSLYVMLFVFSGILAFELLDRLTGEWSVVHTEWARSYIVDPFMNKPLVWFILSLVVWAGVACVMYYLTREIDDKSAGAISYRIKVNKPLNVDALDKYLAFKSIIGEDGVADEDTTLQRLVYDIKHGFLLDVHLTISRRASAPAKLRPETLKIRFFTELQEAAVLTPEDAATVIDNTVTDTVEQHATEGVAVCLKVKVPNERYYREIPFGCQTYLELREQIAIKFKVKPVQVLQIFKVPDTLIADDEDAVRIQPNAVLEILLKS
ncbi:hypothetical protein BE221DRAFT_195435 [Ostreococcus tauri]|uniref:Uncharacterized protein n=1 Tax=Ostreococcus tauri TaxID=70448 RepID=A0A1Y5IF76_OSTTA|nr:hypothetical protein BE221DRAFT_195435 [Ostreococcus tauri]